MCPRPSSSILAVTPPSCGSSSRVQARVDAILVTHADADHVLGLADLAEGTGAPVYAPKGIHVPPTGAVGLAGRARDSLDRHRADRRRDAGRRRIVFEVVAFPAIRPTTSPSTRTARSSPAICSSRDPSGASTWRAATGTRCSSRCARSPSVAPETRSIRSRPADDARRRARAQPVPRGAPRVTPRSRRRAERTTSSVRAAALAVGDREMEGVSSLRLPPDPDAGIRGHRAVHTHVGRGLRRRPEGDVHVHRSRRPLADAAAGGHRADLPRVPPARPAREPQPQKLFTIGPFCRYDRPQRGRYREHWQLSVEAIGSDDPAIDAEMIKLYDAC